MSSASAAARASFLSTSTISRPTPRITRAYAAVAPTSPLPTMPTFMRRLPLAPPGAAGSRGREPLLPGELRPRLVVDEVVRLAAVLEGGPGRELRELDLGDGVLDVVRLVVQ